MFNRKRHIFILSVNNSCLHTLRYPFEAFQFRFLFFNSAAPTVIYTLSLHDALPISQIGGGRRASAARSCIGHGRYTIDRKSTRLNSSHLVSSYAVFCLKKKNKENHARKQNPS